MISYLLGQAGIHFLVSHLICSDIEGILAVDTGERLLFCVNPNVINDVCLFGLFKRANFAEEHRVVSVSRFVQGSNFSVQKGGFRSLRLFFLWCLTGLGHHPFIQINILIRATTVHGILV